MSAVSNDWSNVTEDIRHSVDVHVQEMERTESPAQDKDAVRWLMDHFRREKSRLQEDLEQASRASARLTTLYAAVDQLHGSLDRAAVIEAIHDIVINVVGAEQLAVFELDSSGACLNLVSSVGVDTTPLKEVGFGEGLVGRISASRRLFLKRNESLDAGALWEESINACIPLKVNRRLTGVIAIFGVQAQKHEFSETDIEIFELLSKHAALAMYASALHTETLKR